jgi:molecular chaperone GrpE
MKPRQDPLSQDDSDALPEIPSDGTVELSLDEAEALDLQALADEVAESTGSGNGVDPTMTPEMESLMHEAQQRIQHLERVDAEHRDKHHRLMADFANYRNRTAREIQMAVDAAEKKLLLEILPIVDNFERCLGASYPSVEAIHNGVLLIHKQCSDALRRAGVEPVPLDPGDPFDAQHSEALTTTQDPSIPDGAVAVVLERGYTLRSTLLRPARVIVNNLDGYDAGAEVDQESPNQ